jgi:Na+/serine symporter
LVNTPPFPYSINEILEKLQTNLIFTIKELWVANMFGILAWAVIIIPISAFLFYILKHSFQRLSLTINNNI